MKTILLILFSIIVGILLFPVFVVYSLTKKDRWKVLKNIYKDWFTS